MARLIPFNLLEDQFSIDTDSSRIYQWCNKLIDIH